jgi:hypothetical protein
MVRLKYDVSPPTDLQTGEIIDVTGRKRFSKDYLKAKKNPT